MHKKILLRLWRTCTRVLWSFHLYVTMEQLLIIARDSPHRTQYDVSGVAAEFRKVQRVRNLRAKRKDKGVKRRKTASHAASDCDSAPCDSESEADMDGNLSDVSAPSSSRSSSSGSSGSCSSSEDDDDGDSSSGESNSD